MTRWAYHGTEESLLPGIARRGLVPRGGPRYSASGEGDDPNAVVTYFTDYDFWAEEYGDVVVRFPWPEDTKQWTRLMWNAKAGVPYVTEYRTWHSVPASDVEVRVGMRWVPLCSQYNCAGDA